MARKITATSGDVKATLSGNGFEYTERLLELAAPETYKIIQEEFSKILENAKREWLVRAPNKRGFPTTKGSKKKLGMGVRLNRDMEIIAYLENTAEYAWAIRAGKDSDTTIPYGKRIADELLWKPAKKATDRIVKSLADELIK